MIAMAGGVMGVVMMIPLRQPMIIEQKELKFPEGVACAEVLKAGDRGGAEMMGIFTALGLGAAVQGAGRRRRRLQGHGRMGPTTRQDRLLLRHRHLADADGGRLHRRLGGLAAGLSRRSDLVLLRDSRAGLGRRLLDGTGDRRDLAVWDEQIRFFGIGAMVVAGIYSIFKIAGSMGAALRTAAQGVRGLETATSRCRAPSRGSRARH